MVGPAPARSQATYQQRGNALPPAPKAEFSELPARFRFDAPASAALHHLWERSVAAGREMVGCVAGELSAGDGVRITRVLVLESSRGDSLGVSAQASIDRCGPPDFTGTVHTHIAHYDGEHPYSVFSGADRGVMLLWWRHWQREGMFCVLYTEADAYCEVMGGRGARRMSRGPY